MNPPTPAETLLHRQIRQFSLPPFLKGERVLVTGGGGSIGAELCRQIIRQEPERLILFDISENGAYALQQEFRRGCPERASALAVEIGSIRDRDRLSELFSAYRPQTVFHAAAHKHVPLMEHNPKEAVKNNVFGTQNVLDAAAAFGASGFFLISTDKAVNPSSVMGATKRLAEHLAALDWGGMVAAAVRFGNVLDSAGSVVPLFRQQIAAGGPVTLTDRRVTRYFMTIPEAAALVLEAARMAKGGELFMLDMGEPVSILALAQALIRESGKDVPIAFTGLRPGEKLQEELVSAAENLLPTACEQIFRVESQHPCREALEGFLAQLEAALNGSPEQVKTLLMEGTDKL